MTRSDEHRDEESSHRGGFGEFAGESTGLIDRSFREQIVLVGVQFPGASDDQVDANLDELAQLVDTAGADPVDRVIQKREAPDPATYVGKGKATEIQETSDDADADTVRFLEAEDPDHDLCRRCQQRQPTVLCGTCEHICCEQCVQPGKNGFLHFSMVNIHTPLLPDTVCRSCIYAGGAVST